MFAYTTQETIGYIITNDQMRVPSVSNTSNDASGRFFNPNCIGVKAKLKMRLSMNGKRITKEISPLRYL
jgi:hypothetical protein